MSGNWFDGYDADFVRLADSIRKNNMNIPNFVGEEKKAAMAQTESFLAEAENTLKLMQGEARSAQSGSLREALAARLTERGAELNKLKSESLRARSALPTSTKGELFGVSGMQVGPELEPTAASQRQRLLATNATLESSTATLQETRRVLSDTTQRGVVIMEDLGRQRTQLQGVRSNLDVVDEDLTRGQGILRRISRRMMTNKMCTALIILTLLGIIGFVLWYHFKPSSSGGSGANATALASEIVAMFPSIFASAPSFSTAATAAAAAAAAAATTTASSPTDVLADPSSAAAGVATAGGSSSASAVLLAASATVVPS